MYLEKLFLLNLHEILAGFNNLHLVTILKKNLGIKVLKPPIVDICHGSINLIKALKPSEKCVAKCRISAGILVVQVQRLCLVIPFYFRTKTKPVSNGSLPERCVPSSSNKKKNTAKHSRVIRQRRVVTK